MTDDLEVEVTDVIDGPGTMATVWTFGGVDVDSGDLITFAADHRPAEALWEALVDSEVPVAPVPVWAVICREADE